MDGITCEFQGLPARPEMQETILSGLRELVRQAVAQAWAPYKESQRPNAEARNDAASDWPAPGPRLLGSKSGSSGSLPLQRFKTNRAGRSGSFRLPDRPNCQYTLRACHRLNTRAQSPPEQMSTAEKANITIGGI